MLIEVKHSIHCVFTINILKKIIAQRSAITYLIYLHHYKPEKKRNNAILFN
jgi:hypothetical protein